MHYGPLTAITGGIAVASNDALHLRITPEGVTHHRGATVISETIPWSDIIGIEVNLPSSWFPWPGALATTGYALVTLLSGQVEDVHSEESSITVSLADDKHLELPRQSRSRRVLETGGHQRWNPAQRVHCQAGAAKPPGAPGASHPPIRERNPLAHTTHLRVEGTTPRTHSVQC